MLQFIYIVNGCCIKIKIVNSSNDRNENSSEKLDGLKSRKILFLKTVKRLLCKLFFSFPFFQILM